MIAAAILLRHVEFNISFANALLSFSPDARRPLTARSQPGRPRCRDTQSVAGFAIAGF